jgi:hypothetical protein
LIRTVWLQVEETERGYISQRSNRFTSINCYILFTFPIISRRQHTSPRYREPLTNTDSTPLISSSRSFAWHFLGIFLVCLFWLRRGVSRKSHHSVLKSNYPSLSFTSPLLCFLGTFHSTKKETQHQSQSDRDPK